ncbi:DNA-binding transcriptional MerR regulator [Kitasatospora gansuensis]|uniref:DNA-binding transcriptional MerR regulator n=1 Tax=Kitasatospora gansuensis TaxID=258050 RepID=A0A7W7WFX9_9ACTN|nr:MerR family transcriptional regulator [Kitasatospora gansuensis]MBB4945045.1 DNA-binding transcriptional MerR regulator [Kitasatospora gansuensis]
MWSIGELAERAGATVKTVRYYSDQGLLPEAARSSGGHRRYGPEALDRLAYIRSLRTLDLPVAEVGRVLEREEVLEDVIAGQLRELGSQLTALRWRESALQLLRDCTGEERADRLRLIGAISTPPNTEVLARFWRRLLPLRLPAGLLSSILDEAVPQPPVDPTPGQVLAFARLHAMADAFCRNDCRPVPQQEEGYRPAVFYQGLGEAYALARTDLLAYRPPGAEALDCFVAAHADSRGLRDTPDFRRQLSGVLAQSADPVMVRYWKLTAEVTGSPEPTMGATHHWLQTTLEAQLA